MCHGHADTVRGEGQSEVSACLSDGVIEQSVCHGHADTVRGEGQGELSACLSDGVREQSVCHGHVDREQGGVMDTRPDTNSLL